MKKITLIGIANNIATQFTDQQGNLNVDMPVKIIETRQVNGESVEETDWVRVVAVGNTAQNLAAIAKDSHVYIEGDARFDEIPNAQGVPGFYLGVRAYKVIPVAAQQTYINIVANGNLGRDPEMRYTQSGKAVTSFSIAVNDRRADETLWVDITCWDRLAEITNTHLNKGRSVLIDGRPSAHRWTQKDGQPRGKMEVIANTVEFIGGQRNDTGAPTNAGGGYQQSAPQQGGYRGPVQGGQPAQPAYGGQGYEAPQGQEDDLPW
ncbi:MAG: single-stranded DNA-binding protein [Chloroflexota bacterium]|nr:single-stranded DNA-binding protein [Chloroflexota bacterium]